MNKIEKIKRTTKKLDKWLAYPHNIPGQLQKCKKLFDCDYFTEIPYLIITFIFDQLNIIDMLNFRSVCKYLYNVGSCKICQKEIIGYHRLSNNPNAYKNICMSLSKINIHNTVIENIVKSLTIRHYSVLVNNDYGFPGGFMGQPTGQEILILLDCSYISNNLLCRLVLFEYYTDDDSGSMEIECIHLNIGIVGFGIIISHIIKWRTFDCISEDGHTDNYEGQQEYRKNKIIDELSKLKSPVCLHVDILSALLFNLQDDSSERIHKEIYDDNSDVDLTFINDRQQCISYKEKCENYIKSII